jgi:hypothetical protein
MAGLSDLEWSGSSRLPCLVLGSVPCTPLPSQTHSSLTCCLAVAINRLKTSEGCDQLRTGMDVRIRGTWESTVGGEAKKWHQHASVEKHVHETMALFVAVRTQRRFSWNSLRRDVGLIDGEL